MTRSKMIVNDLRVKCEVQCFVKRDGNVCAHVFTYVKAVGHKEIAELIVDRIRAEVERYFGQDEGVEVDGLGAQINAAAKCVSNAVRLVQGKYEDEINSDNEDIVPEKVRASSNSTQYYLLGPLSGLNNGFGQDEAKILEELKGDPTTEKKKYSAFLHDLSKHIKKNLCLALFGVVEAFETLPPRSNKLHSISFPRKDKTSEWLEYHEGLLTVFEFRDFNIRVPKEGERWCAAGRPNVLVTGMDWETGDHGTVCFDNGEDSHCLKRFFELEYRLDNPEASEAQSEAAQSEAPAPSPSKKRSVEETQESNNVEETRESNKKARTDGEPQLLKLSVDKDGKYTTEPSAVGGIKAGDYLLDIRGQNVQDCQQWAVRKGGRFWKAMEAPLYPKFRNLETNELKPYDNTDGRFIKSFVLVPLSIYNFLRLEYETEKKPKTGETLTSQSGKEILLHYSGNGQQHVPCRLGDIVLHGNKLGVLSELYSTHHDKVDYAKINVHRIAHAYGTLEYELVLGSVTAVPSSLRFVRRAGRDNFKPRAGKHFYYQLDKECKVGDRVTVRLRKEGWATDDPYHKAKIIELLHYGEHGMIVEESGKQYYARISDIVKVHPNAHVSAGRGGNKTDSPQMLDISSSHGNEQLAFKSKVEDGMAPSPPPQLRKLGKNEKRVSMDTFFEVRPDITSKDLPKRDLTDEEKKFEQALVSLCIPEQLYTRLRKHCVKKDKLGYEVVKQSSDWFIKNDREYEKKQERKLIAKMHYSAMGLSLQQRLKKPLYDVCREFSKDIDTDIVDNGGTWPITIWFWRKEKTLAKPAAKRKATSAPAGAEPEKKQAKVAKQDWIDQHKLKPWETLSQHEKAKVVKTFWTIWDKHKYTDQLVRVEPNDILPLLWYAHKAGIIENVNHTQRPDNKSFYETFTIRFKPLTFAILCLRFDFPVKNESIKKTAKAATKLRADLEAMKVDKSYIDVFLVQVAKQLKAKQINVKQLYVMFVKDVGYDKKVSIRRQKEFIGPYISINIRSFPAEAARVYDSLCQWEFMMFAYVNDADMKKIFEHGGLGLFLKDTEDTGEKFRKYHKQWQISTVTMDLVWRKREVYHSHIEEGTLEEWRKAHEIPDPDIKEFWWTYRDNEDRNRHGQNYVMIVETFGTEAQKKRMKSIVEKKGASKAKWSDKEKEWAFSELMPMLNKSLEGRIL